MSDRAERQKQDRLKEQLKKLQLQIDESPKEARLYNQEGDLHAQLGDDKSALKAYGKAINVYISAGQVNPASALCVKVTRRYPNVVRTHFTLACLALHQGLWMEAIEALDAYVASAIETDTQPLAIPRLRFLSRGVTDTSVRKVIAQHLHDLGDLDEADFIRTRPPRPLPEGIKRERVFLDAPLWDGDAVWATYWTH